MKHGTWTNNGTQPVRIQMYFIIMHLFIYLL